MPQAVRDYEIQEVGDDEVDYELPSANALTGSHANLIPIPGNVQSTRVFYGARFFNQSLPVVGGEAPLVQSLIDNDADGRSFDDHYGERAGAVRADDDYEVLEVLKDRLRLKNARNEVVEKELYDELPFNRKSMITHRPLVKVGDKVARGTALAASNYTDDNGTLAMGLNARIGIVPYKGYSMDDAVVIRQGFADRLRSQTTETFKQDRDEQTIIGRNHFHSLFADKFTKDQLALVDNDGVITPGTIINPGDPMILATRPRVLSSTSGELGKLSKTMRQVRSDASQVWEGDGPGRVMKVAKTKKGVKVVVLQERGTKEGDKITLRHGQKGTVSLILPDDHMPRTTDGDPLDMMLNPQGMPSRANFSTLYELLLGKVAKKNGAPIKLPMFLPPGENMYDYVEAQLKAAGLSDVEDVFDPQDNRKLENPITVGMGFIQKLHHTSASKADARGQGSYDCYDAHTEVLTSQGWKPWPAVVEADLLYTPDLNSGLASYEKPSMLVCYEFDGELLGYQSRKLDFLVTPNHKFAYATPKVTSWRTAHASELYGRRIFLPRAGCALAAMPVPETKVFPNVPATRKRSVYEGEVEIAFTDYVELCAWWAAEGSVDEVGRLTIWQRKDVNPGNYVQITALLARVGGCPPFEWDDHRGVRLSDPRIGFYFKSYGSQSHDKRIPEDLRLLRGPLASLFMDTYVKGDGSNVARIHNGRATINRVESIASSSLPILDTIQQLAIHRGLMFHYSLIKAKGSVCRGLVSKKTGEPYISKVDTYGGCVHKKLDRSMTVQASNRDARYTGMWYTQPYEGRVYCATTSTGYLMVRRNGKVMIAGNSNQQPAKGGDGGAKRLSGLETHALMSSGAYATLREGATIRGQKNDDYWRMLRAGNTPRDPDEPFVWKKFRGLMSGAGLRMRDEPGGKNRLGPMTDDDVDAYKPLEVRNGRTLDLRTLEPEKGGLFDQALVGNNMWGKITLPEPVLNPAFEGPARHLLGLKLKDLQSILAGEMDLPEEMQQRIAERVRMMTKDAAAQPAMPQPLHWDPAWEAPQQAAKATPSKEPATSAPGLVNKSLVRNALQPNIQYAGHYAPRQFIEPYYGKNYETEVNKAQTYANRELTNRPRYETDTLRRNHRWFGSLSQQTLDVAKPTAQTGPDSAGSVFPPLDYTRLEKPVPVFTTTSQRSFQHPAGVVVSDKSTPLSSEDRAHNLMGPQSVFETPEKRIQTAVEHEFRHQWIESPETQAWDDRLPYQTTGPTFASRAEVGLPILGPDDLDYPNRTVSHATGQRIDGQPKTTPHDFNYYNQSVSPENWMQVRNGYVPEDLPAYEHGLSRAEQMGWASGLQQALYKRNGRRLESPEEAAAYLDRVVKTLEPEEFEQEVSDFPNDSARGLRYLRDLQLRTDPGWEPPDDPNMNRDYRERLIRNRGPVGELPPADLYMNWLSTLLPGLVGNGQPDEQAMKMGSVQPAFYDPNFEREPAPAFSVPKTGPDAIHLALAAVDLDELEKTQKDLVASGKVSKRNGAVQTLNAISGLRANKVRPEQLMITKVPVIPPAFRPFALVGETFIPGDANELYKDLFDLKETLAEAKQTFGDEGAVAERRAFQSAVKAVYGYGDPVNPKSQQRGVSGFLRQISGSNPKFSFFQRKLISKTQDQVGRGVITPDPELTLDEIGVPEEMAWEMYGTYIMRRLVRDGMHRSEALRQIKDRSKFARQALEKELPERPVVYSRSPAWHKYNIISGTPRLIEGDTIRISPFVAAGLGADYDGDTVNLHVPASPDAVREAKELLRPSSMLFSIKDDEKVVPKLVQEQILGPYAASQRASKALHSFPDRESALKAIRTGQISLADEIEFPDIPVKAKVAAMLDGMWNRC